MTVVYMEHSLEDVIATFFAKASVSRDHLRWPGKGFCRRQRRPHQHTGVSIATPSILDPSEVGHDDYSSELYIKLVFNDRR